MMDGAGFHVDTHDDGIIIAIDKETGEQFIVRYRRPEHQYDACVELAVMVGVELEDG